MSLIILKRYAVARPAGRIEANERAPAEKPESFLPFLIFSF